MTKHRQPKSLDSLDSFLSRDTPVPASESQRITALERRVATLEGLLNDVMHQLDKPDSQPKSKMNGKPKGNGKPKAQKSKTPTPKPKKAKTKKTPPSQMITSLLKQKPHSRAEMEASTGMDTAAIRKCMTWMTKQDLIEKTTEKDDDGNSRWSLKE